MVGSTVRRAVAVADSLRHNTMDDMPSWGPVVLALTIFAFLALLIAVNYTVDGVVRTLAMVEQPGADLEPDSDADPAKESLLADEKAEAAAHPRSLADKPITSTISSTLRHIRSVAGRLAPWRGAAAYAVYSVAGGMLAEPFMFVLPRTPLARAASGLVGFTLAGSFLHTAWTLAVVAAPGQSASAAYIACVRALAPFRRQLLAASFARELALRGPALVWHAVAAVARLSGAPLARRAGAMHPGCSSVAFCAAALFVAAVLAALYVVFVLLPTETAAARVEASLLSDDQHPIVPLDRSFAGKVVPGVTCLSLGDAWRSVDRATRRRVAAIYFKLVLFTFAVVAVMVSVLALEFTALVGGRGAAGTHLLRLRRDVGWA